VSVKPGGGGLVFGRPEKLFEIEYGNAFPGHSWDVAPDGRFVFLKFPDEASRRAFYETVAADRIHIDLDGLPKLLEKAGKGR
jgi:hypothetical protein